MFCIGDLVKVKSLMTGREYLDRYIDSEFTIVEIYQDTYYCIRGNMIYNLMFYISELELAVNKPKYSIGTLVEDKRYNGYLHVFPLGVVEHSNRLGSMVRFRILSDSGEHSLLYKSNRNLRKVK